MTMRSKAPSRTCGVTGSPSSVFDIAGYRLMEESESSDAVGVSCQSALESVMTPVSSPADDFYVRGRQGSILTCSSSDGLKERERRTLSDLMLQRNWAEARQRLASAAHEHEIYERIPMPYTSNDVSHALLLHLACALRPLPPASFVRFLIKLHPDAARVQEDMWGLLPLHFAANLSQGESKNLRDEFDRIDGDDEVTLSSVPLVALERLSFNQKCIISSLVDAFPDSLAVKDGFSGMLPIHIAASTTSSHCNWLTSNAASILEMFIQKCPESVDVLDDYGESPRDIAWRNATFNCLRCRVRGRYVASVHGRCPHVEHPQSGKTNPLLRQDFDWLFESRTIRCLPDDTKALTYRSVSGATDTTAMSDDSQHLSSSNSDGDISRDDIMCTTSIDAHVNDTKDTLIRLVAKNEWSVSMQIRLESLHSGKGKKWSKKLRQKRPNPFFEISVIPEESSFQEEIIYRSYPVMKTKDATWDKIEALDVKLDSSCPTKLRFRITVFDCDVKGGKHLLIGESEVHSTDLARQTARLIPIQRNNKVKGFLRLAHIQLDSA